LRGKTTKWGAERSKGEANPAPAYRVHAGARDSKRKKQQEIVPAIKGAKGRNAGGSKKCKRKKTLAQTRWVNERRD